MPARVVDLFWHDLQWKLNAVHLMQIASWWLPFAFTREVMSTSLTWPFLPPVVECSVQGALHDHGCRISCMSGLTLVAHHHHHHHHHHRAVCEGRDAAPSDA
jgi:hypothetical protein